MTRLQTAVKKQTTVAAGCSRRGGAQLCQSGSLCRSRGGQEDLHASLRAAKRMELYRKVRLACRDGMSERAAARHFGISRQSVRKAVASLAAIARLTLTSRPAGEEIAWQVSDADREPRPVLGDPECALAAHEQSEREVDADEEDVGARGTASNSRRRRSSIRPAKPVRQPMPRQGTGSETRRGRLLLPACGKPRSASPPLSTGSQTKVVHPAALASAKHAVWLGASPPAHGERNQCRSAHAPASYPHRPRVAWAHFHRLSPSGVIPFKNLKRSLSVERTRVVFAAMRDL